MSLADFEKVTVLGAGAFGQVLLVRQGPKYYALKVLSKQHLLQTGLQVRSRSRRSSAFLFESLYALAFFTI